MFPLRVTTNRKLSWCWACTGNPARPYAAVLRYGNEVDPLGNHPLTITGRNPRAFADYDEFLWAESASLPAYLRECLAAEREDGAVGLLVHGYNNDFRDAVDEHGAFAAQVAALGCFRGTLLSYTWPSRGGIHLYADDREAALASGSHLRTFLEALASACGERCRPLVVICHSMGGLVVREAARDALRDCGPLESPWLTSLVLAGADLNYHLFDADASGAAAGEGGRALCALAGEVLVLYFEGDAVLEHSERFMHTSAEAKRLGKAGPAKPESLPANVHPRDMTGAITTHGGYLKEPGGILALAEHLTQISHKAPPGG